MFKTRSNKIRMSEIIFGGKKIGLQYRPFIIAELSCNHNQSLPRALEIVEAAAKAGAQALKLQTYTPDTLTLDVKTEEFMLRQDDNLWKGYSLHGLYKLAYTPWEWHRPIMEKAKELGMVCFSAPFDETAVEFLEKLDCPAYKITSFEMNHIPLIRLAASTKKPLFISTGMASKEEIEEAVTTAQDAGCKDIIILKCTSAYPAKVEDANLLTIPDMRKSFPGCEVGLSDHTLGLAVPLAAIAHGATVVEKHLTLRRADGGLDSDFSIEPEELQTMVVETERAWQSLGSVRYGALKSEGPSMQERRSLYIAEDMKAGETLTKTNLRCIRPSYGLHPRYYDYVLGKKLLKNTVKGTPLSWDLIDAPKI
jgi:pseudaminic acid synthase